LKVLVKAVFKLLISFSKIRSYILIPYIYFKNYNNLNVFFKYVIIFRSLLILFINDDFVMLDREKAGNKLK